MTWFDLKEQVKQHQRVIDDLQQQNQILSERLEFHSRDQIDSIKTHSGRFRQKLSNFIFISSFVVLFSSTTSFILNRTEMVTGNFVF